MSTSEPSRIQPRGQSHDTKTAQQAYEEKSKVEKIREVDEEATRKRQQFRSFLEDDKNQQPQETTPPSPFEIFSQDLSNKQPQDSSDLYDDVNDSIIASPSYSTPPGLESILNEKDSAQVEDLPRSDQFWKKVHIDNKDPTSSHIIENPKSKEHTKDAEKTKLGIPLHTLSQQEREKLAKQKEKASLFGPPGKPEIEKTIETKKVVKEEKPKLPSPFEEAAKTSSLKSKQEKKEKIFEKEEEIQPGFFEPQKEIKTSISSKEPTVASITAIANFPQQITQVAVQATNLAKPYISPTTVPIFFQMVGTLYVMAAPPGISRTEIVLNNPAFANSKFFGTTITIEKYATAPDSFNIRLTGSDAAVSLFKDNIPNLLSAFQKVDLPFKVGRIDAEYRSERPIFKRKESTKEQDTGDTGENRK